MNELTARNMTLKELASYLRDHADPVVRVFAIHVLTEVASSEEEIVEEIE